MKAGCLGLGGSGFNFSIEFLAVLGALCVSSPKSIGGANGFSLMIILGCLGLNLVIGRAHV